MMVVVFTSLPKKSINIEPTEEKNDIQKFIKFKTVSLDGDTINIDEYLKNKNKVVINLWATWCKPCLEEISILNTAYKTFNDKEITFIAISCDDSKVTAQRFLEQHSFLFKQVFIKDINTTQNIWDDLVNQDNSTIKVKSLPLHLFYDDKTGKYKIMEGAYMSFEEYERDMKSFFNL
ncbi:MAG: TlpA family protein disulfide reductase [Bacteroidetes bacterium]|jgi:thiol-disulfide isomerase/thioredoxin|nr:TlpA family protein disulfide reductase [Bacteroidota bacterium]